MKKRLLSAALALAMVLTLLPVSAFAADPGIKDGDTVTWAPATTDDGRVYGHWYRSYKENNETKYVEVTTGLVTGTSGSGKWHASVDDYLNSKKDQVSGSFTVLGISSLDLSSYTNSSLTIDVATTTSITGVPKNLTSLTITSKYAQTGNGTVNKIETSRVGYTNSDDNTRSGLTITATDINLGGVDLGGRNNTLNLTNCNITGEIKMNGNYFASASAEDKSTYSYGAEKISASNCRFNNNGITITNSKSSTVSLTDTLGVGDINVTSDGGSVTVAGRSSTGEIVTVPLTYTGTWPSVTVTGGTVDVITQGAYSDSDGRSNSKTITVKADNTTGITSLAGVVVNNGSVTITSADVSGSVTVKAGSLSITGSGVDVGGWLVLGETDKTNLSITATKSTFDHIQAMNGANLNIGGWNGDRWPNGNYYGQMDLSTYSGKKVTGGSFAKVDGSPLKKEGSKEWFSSDLQFVVLVDSGNMPGSATARFDLYKKDELSQAISDIKTEKAKSDYYITILCQGANGRDQKQIVLQNGKTEWAKISYDASTSILLPARINNVDISTWIAENNSTVPVNQTQTIPYDGTNDVVLNATGISTNVKRISKATAAANPPTVENQNVRVSLNGNNILVSGAVTGGVGDIATVYIDLETDAVDTAGAPIVIRNVLVDYEVATKKVSFNTIVPNVDREKYGVIIQDGALVLNKGTGAKYTVSASLSESASVLRLYTAGNEIQFTVNVNRWTNEQKNALINELKKTSSFDINGNSAMLEAINAAQATITSNTSVASWITSAKNNIWKNGIKDATGKDYITVGGRKMVPHTGTFNSQTDDGAAIAANFDRAYIVPYLAVNITAYDEVAGTLTATLVPSYRVNVSKDGAYNKDAAYTVQAGKALSALTGDMSTPVLVKLGLGSTFNGKYMHQDGKYVYRDVAGTGTWNINHAGANGSLGTININGTVGPISITSSIENGKAADGSGIRVPAILSTYDSLQAAVDDTIPGSTVLNDGTAADFKDQTYDTITVGGTYTGNGTFTMTGLARTILIDAQGMEDVKCSSQNVRMQTAGSYRHVFQLEQGTVVEETPDTTVSVIKATGGSARVSNSKAKAGEKVTITLTPSTGYTSNGVTVRTAEGTTVTATGSGNSYSFTMPSNTKKVTVTPAFKKTDTTGATVTVSNTSNGGATTSAGTNKVNPGTRVTVKTTPRTGYRTMGLYVTANSGTATATRTGDDTFTFTVPSNATNVVVTPRFDVNNGTKFEDVWSTEYYSTPVAWAVNRGVTDGTSTYTFSPNNSCTRADMVTFLYRAAGSPAVGNVANPFWDVQPGAYYYNAVLWAVSKGITKGVEWNRFGVNEYVTRGQAVTFLYRYNNSPAASNYSGFYDVSGSEYYAQAVAWARASGVTDGTSATLFSPYQYVTRAQAVTFLYRNSTGVRA